MSLVFPAHREISSFDGVDLLLQNNIASERVRVGAISGVTHVTNICTCTHTDALTCGSTYMQTHRMYIRSILYAPAYLLTCTPSKQRY